MRLLFTNTYDRWKQGSTCEVPSHLVVALIGSFAEVVMPEAEEVKNEHSYRVLQEWAKFVGLPANQSREKLENQLLIAIKETPDGGAEEPGEKE